MGSIKVDFIAKNAKQIVSASPVAYVKDAQLRGSCFDSEHKVSGLVSSAFTNFYVDHDEPLAALAEVREYMDWPLGELLDGDEFLVLLEVRRRRSS